MAAESIALRRALRAPWRLWLESKAAWDFPIYGVTVFAAALAAFWIVIPFGDFDTIIGDNICQVAYWRILIHHVFVGSVGASSMKPGLVLLLGAAHDWSLALFHSTILIKVVFTIAAASLVALVEGIARPLGGKIAGAAAAVYLITQTPALAMFTDGTSMIVFLPLLICGVWLFDRDRERAGAVVLCLAALIRIEAFLVLFLLALVQQLLKRRFRAFAFSTAVVIVALAITGFVYFRVQGSVARFNAGGPPVGYVFDRDPSALSRLLGTLKYTASAGAQTLFEECGFPYLAMPALLACIVSRARAYFALCGVPIFLIVYISVGQGNAELRYFQFLVPVVAAFGAAGVVMAFRGGGTWRDRAPSWAWLLMALCGASCFALGAPKPLCSLATLFIAVALGALFRKWPLALPPSLPKLASVLVLWVSLLNMLKHQDWRPMIARGSFTIDALNLLRHSPVPRGQRVLTEDDLIYSVISRNRNFFRDAHALQDFNIRGDAQRAEILGSTDYILLSKRNYSYYYLAYDPLRRGFSDPFRRAILAARTIKRSANVYGYSLTPTDSTRDWLVLKVEPEHAPPRPQ